MVEGRAVENAKVLITQVISTVKVLETYVIVKKLSNPTVTVNEYAPTSK